MDGHPFMAVCFNIYITFTDFLSFKPAFKSMLLFDVYSRFSFLDGFPNLILFAS